MKASLFVVATLAVAVHPALAKKPPSAPAATAGPSTAVTP